VKLVMTSWATYPRLDPTRPAGLSRIVIEHELRQRLGFRGVVITDSIDAGAVSDIPLATRSVLAAKAGADLILCAITNPNANSPNLGIAVTRALANAIRSGEVARFAAQAAAARVLSLRRNP
jgi:beta-N-acetylhexosaminidase